MSSIETRPERRTRLTRAVAQVYALWIVPRVEDPLRRQRLKLIWYGWRYLPLLTVSGLSLAQRVRLLARFLAIDWNVLHAHLPEEIVAIARSLAERRGRPREALIEAGCWQGGSSTKFSLLCAELGYELHIYDSFQGVEDVTGLDEWDFTGQYASPESRLRENLDRFGVPRVCHVHPGWFADTLGRGPVPFPVRVGYIDCDLGKGTREALAGIVPSLAEDGWIFTQDYHIEPVRRVLNDRATWSELGASRPSIVTHSVYLASMRPRRS